MSGIGWADADLCGTEERAGVWARRGARGLEQDAGRLRLRPGVISASQLRKREVWTAGLPQPSAPIPQMLG